MISRWLRLAIPLSLAVLVSVIAIYPASDCDTFWHLANGRWMIEHEQIAGQELFSYSARGAPFDNRYWLAQIGLFAIYDWTGINGLIVFKSLSMALTVALLYGAARSAGASAGAAWTVLALTSYALVWRMLERPELFSFLLLALLVAITFAVRFGRLRPPWLWLLPPVFLLWDSLHPGSIFGLAYLGAFVAGELLLVFMPSGRTTPDANTSRWLAEPRRTLFLATLAIFLLQLAIPGATLRALDLQELASDRSVFREFGEFMRTPMLWGFAPFWILAGGGLVSAGMSLWRREAIPFLVLAIFLPLGVAYSRGTALFAIVAAPFLARDLTALGQWASSRDLPDSVWRGMGGLSAVGFILFTVHYKFFAESHTNSFGWGLNTSYHPEASVRFLNETRVGGRMFNLGHQGGYLAFVAPDRPIFFYNFPHPFASVYRDMKSAGLARRWNFNYAIIGDSYNNWRQQFPIEEWAAVYWEPAAMVMFRRNDTNREIIRRYEIHYFTPYRPHAELRALARQVEIGPRLARELSDHLTWRRDDQLAALLSEILLDPALPLTREQRLVLRHRAQRSNPEPEQLKR